MTLSLAIWIIVGLLCVCSSLLLWACLKVAGKADADIKMMRRRARRAGVKLSTVSYEKLTPPQQLAHTAKSSIVGAIAAIATDKAIQKVESAASGRSGELPIGETLRALGYAK